MQLAEPPIALFEKASLFLDFDGTLVELASTPSRVEVGAELLELLLALQTSLEGRVALLSGRPAADVSGLLDPVELAIGGSHGLERSLPGRADRPPMRPEGLDQAVEQLRALELDYPGVHIEEKPAGVAIHYRLAPGAAIVCQEQAERAAMAIGMALQLGKMVVELKPPGADKGSALRAFMLERPFSGTRPIFIGDDLTDEHGFVAAREFGGTGILVGTNRPTAACYRLDDVKAVRAWLRAACERMQ